MTQYDIYPSMACEGAKYRWNISKTDKSVVTHIGEYLTEEEVKALIPGFIKPGDTITWEE